MKLTFIQTPEDVVDLCKNSYQQNNSIKIILTIAILLLLSSIAIRGFTLNTLISWLIPIVIIVILWYLIFKMIRKRMTSSKNGELVTGNREVEFLEDSILYKTDISEATFLWKGVTKLSESSKNYFLYLGKQRAIIIPKTAFSNPSEKDIFLSLVNRKLPIEKK